MFGYIRPDIGELKVKEFGRFRACYCGLCHELGRGFGSFSRFILNYDFVFLTMLLDTGTPSYEMRRCTASPFCKKCVCAHSDAGSCSAAYSVILAYWKLCDSVKDDGVLNSTASWIKRLFLNRAFKQATKQYPEFSDNVSARLSELSALENRNEPSLDKMADKFAQLLALAAEGMDDEIKRRLLYELLYHVGRIIYIADAVQDLREDMDAGRYNPLAARFSLKYPELSENDKESVRLALFNSQSRVCAAFELMDETYWTCILRNIIYIGIPLMCGQVLDGTYNNKKTRLPRMGEDR